MTLYIVKPPYHSHCTVQIKTACFILCVQSYTITYYLEKVHKQVYFSVRIKSVLVGAAIKSTKVGIKMHALSFCLISAARFNAFHCSP